MALYTSGVLCEQVLEERDGALSAIRIIDHVFADLPAAVPKTIMVITPIRFCALLSFKSDGPEEFDAVFTAIEPSGNRINPQPMSLRTDGAEKGHLVRIRLAIDPRMIGLWWFEVEVRGEVKLRMPLEVRSASPDHPTENRSPQEHSANS